MKKVTRSLILVMMMLMASLQNISAQSIESQMRSFFSYNENQAYWWLSKFAHPTNVFRSGSLTMSGENVYVTIYADGASSGSYTTKFRIHKDGSRFDYIEVTSDNDWVSPFIATEIAKNLAANFFRNNYPDTLSMIENMYGKKLDDMTARELCASVLTVLLWKYPG